jgi:arsenate reductase (thioredoxin)
MTDKPDNVLFIRARDSARSMLAEGPMNHPGGAQLQTPAKGSQPSGTVIQQVLKTLPHTHYPTDSPRSLLTLPMAWSDRLAIQRNGKDIGTR